MKHLFTFRRSITFRKKSDISTSVKSTKKFHAFIKRNSKHSTALVT